MHRKQPIKINGQELDIDLESPALLDYHDNMSVRLSEISQDVDPEKLKFHVSALAGQPVTQLVFDETRTKAVAEFRDVIGKCSIFGLTVTGPNHQFTSNILLQ